MVAAVLLFALLLSPFALLAYAENPQGRCGRLEPKPCTLSLDPASGLIFLGTILLAAGPTTAIGYALWAIFWRDAEVRRGAPIPGVEEVDPKEAPPRIR